MPTGSASRSRGTDSPVRALKLSMKKSAYLKTPSSPRLMTTQTVSHSFFPRFDCARFMARPQP